MLKKLPWFRRWARRTNTTGRGAETARASRTTTTSTRYRGQTTVNRCRSRSRCSRARCSPSRCPRRGRRCRPEGASPSTRRSPARATAHSPIAGTSAVAPRTRPSSSPQVTFGAAGQYDVTVQVTDSAGDGGGAEIPITVGPPSPAATGSHPQTGSGTSRKSHNPSGPRKSKGTHAGGKPGKSSTGKSTTTGTGNNSSSGTNTATTTSTTSTSTTSSTTPSSTTNTSAHATTPKARPRHASAPASRPAPRPPASGPLVSGLLVSDVTPLAPGASPLVRVVPAAVATAPPARQAIRASLLPAFAAGFAVLLLLGLGAGRELRGRRRRSDAPRRQLRSWVSSPLCP